MDRIGLKSFFVAAALTLGTVAGLRAAEPEADPPQGYLLIAAATMPDPRFAHSVVLLLKHDKEGALGIIINKPFAERPITALLDNDAPKNQPGAKPPDKSPEKLQDKIDGSIELYFGGPVDLQRGFIVHSADYHRDETLTIDGDIGVTADREILRDIGRGRGPKKYLFAIGYAGWSAGQLEGEIERRDWFSAPADPELVFDADRAKLWERALAARSREL